jgi:Ni,Fe-hydrogenase maturation factor
VLKAAAPAGSCGFGNAVGGDEAFGQLVLARIIEPVSNARQLAGIG